MWFELLDLAIGIGFGFSHRGKEAYGQILRNSFIAGVVLSIILLALSAVLMPGEFSSGVLFPGIFGIIVIVVIYIALFVVGTFIGDQLERLIRK